MSQYYMPLDVSCPGARAEVFDMLECMERDPMTIHYGVDVSEFVTVWEDKHRQHCKRCQEFGTANIEVR